MTSIDSITSYNPSSAIKTSNANATATTGTDSKTIMDKDGFLKLFLASLQYQDPMSPMETKDMMNQMSQLGSMEQIANMGEAINELKMIMSTFAKGNVSEASNALGSYIKAITSSGEVVEGKVEQLFNDSENVYLVVGDKLVLMNEVVVMQAQPFEKTDEKQQTSVNPEGLSDSSKVDELIKQRQDELVKQQDELVEQ